MKLLSEPKYIFITLIKVFFKDTEKYEAHGGWYAVNTGGLTSNKAVLNFSSGPNLMDFSAWAVE